MHDDLKQLDFALVDDAFDRIFRADSETRQQNKACTPADQQSGVFNNHEGREL